MPQHTPTPWMQVDDLPIILGAADSSGERDLVCGHLKTVRDHFAATPPALSPSTRLANTALIVRAVNSHEELKSALSTALYWAGQATGSYPERDQGLSNARAVLAKARGGAS